MSLNVQYIPESKVSSRQLTSTSRAGEGCRTELTTHLLREPRLSPAGQVSPGEIRPTHTWCAHAQACRRVHRHPGSEPEEPPSGKWYGSFMTGLRGRQRSEETLMATCQLPAGPWSW